MSLNKAIQMYQNFPTEQGKGRIITKNVYIEETEGNIVRVEITKENGLVTKATAVNIEKGGLNVQKEATV